MREGRVFRCTWERVGDAYRAWVRGRPGLAGAGESFAEADEQLWAAILDATGDGENQREYDPPVPPAPGAEPVDVAAYVTPTGYTYQVPYRPEHFDGGMCPECGNARGRRTEVPLAADLGAAADDAGVLIGAGVLNPARAQRFVSERLLGCLTDEERTALVWRELARPPRRRKRHFELIGATPSVPLVGVLGMLEHWGWQCGTCDVVHAPALGQAGWPSYFVAAADLPRPRPAVLAARRGHDAMLIIARDRWRTIGRLPAARRAFAEEVGVVPRGLVVPWPEPK